MKKKYLLSLLVLTIYANEAQAYLDPGTGSMLYQLIAAGIAGVGLVVKLYWRRIQSLFYRESATSDKDKLPSK